MLAKQRAKPRDPGLIHLFAEPPPVWRRLPYLGCLGFDLDISHLDAAASNGDPTLKLERIESFKGIIRWRGYNGKWAAAQTRQHHRQQTVMRVN